MTKNSSESPLLKEKMRNTELFEDGKSIVTWNNYVPQDRKPAKTRESKDQFAVKLIYGSRGLLNFF